MKKYLLGIGLLLLMEVPLWGQQKSVAQEKPPQNPTVQNPSVPTSQPSETSVKSNRTQAVPGEHPLIPVLKWASTGRPKIAALKDYTAVLMKQETINGEKQPAQTMDIKVRHEPFSVYLKFRWPREIAGQEVIYVKGQNNGNMYAHGVGLQRKLGILSLDPNGLIAGRGNKYAITEIGLLNLVDKLVEVGQKDVKYGECTVNYYEGIKDEGKECTMIEVIHPYPRSNFRFYLARILVNNEWNIPVRYESYDWQKENDEEPPLIEIYTYKKLRLNVGLTDKDFSTDNPEYDFPK